MYSYKFVRQFELETKLHVGLIVEPGQSPAGAGRYPARTGPAQPRHHPQDKHNRREVGVTCLWRLFSILVGQWHLPRGESNIYICSTKIIIGNLTWVWEEINVVLVASSSGFLGSDSIFRSSGGERHKNRSRQVLYRKSHLEAGRLDDAGEIVAGFDRAPPTAPSRVLSLFTLFTRNKRSRKALLDDDLAGTAGPWPGNKSFSRFSCRRSSRPRRLRTSPPGGQYARFVAVRAAPKFPSFISPLRFYLALSIFRSP